MKIQKSGHRYIIMLMEGEKRMKKALLLRGKEWTKMQGVDTDTSGVLIR